jgi:hypothetical protein
MSNFISHTKKQFFVDPKWETLINELTLEMIQRTDCPDNSDQMIYHNQFVAAKKFILSLLSWYDGENQHTARNRHGLLSSLPQGGKTGFIAAVINIILTIPGLKSYLKIDKFSIITGMNDIELQDQTKKRLTLQVFGANDNNVDGGIRDKTVGDDILIYVYRNSDLKKKKLIYRRMLCFIDEAHWGSAETSILTKSFKSNGNSIDWKNRQELSDYDVYLCSISATNGSEIASDLEDTKRHVILEVPENYYGIPQYYYNNQIYSADLNDFRKRKDENQGGDFPIIDMLKDAHNRMVEIRNSGRIVKYHPDTREIDLSPKGCVFIRVSEKYNKIIKDNSWVKSHFQVIPIDAKESGRINYADVINFTKSMLPPGSNEKPIIFLVKGGFSAGITKNILVKDNTYMVYDVRNDWKATAQGLVGRMSGVRLNQEFVDITKIYTNIKHIEKYVNWYEEKFVRDYVPANDKYTNIVDLTEDEIEQIKNSKHFDEKRDLRMGTISGEILRKEISDEYIYKIYDIHKNMKRGRNKTGDLLEAVKTRLNLQDILVDLGFDKEIEYDFIAETLIMPGGRTGVMIDGNDKQLKYPHNKIEPYGDKLIRDWFDGDKTGGVKDHGYAHFKHLYKREEFDFKKDVGKKTIHIILDDHNRTLKLVQRILVLQINKPNMSKNIRKHQITTISIEENTIG